MTFEFVYDDDSSVNLEVLYLSFLDLDGPTAGHEVIRLYGVDDFYSHESTGLTISEGIKIFSHHFSHMLTHTSIFTLTFTNIPVYSHIQVPV